MTREQQLCVMLADAIRKVDEASAYAVVATFLALIEPEKHLVLVQAVRLALLERQATGLKILEAFEPQSPAN